MREDWPMMLFFTGMSGPPYGVTMVDKTKEFDSDFLPCDVSAQ